VLSAQFRRQPAYVIKLLTKDGVVKTVRIPVRERSDRSHVACAHRGRHLAGRFPGSCAHWFAVDVDRRRMGFTSARVSIDLAIIDLGLPELPGLEDIPSCAPGRDFRSWC
jgi:hypothetical protein